MSKESAERCIKQMDAGEREKDPSVYEMAIAYTLGIPAVIATDTSEYLDMTLREIAEEWNLSNPVELLAAISEHDKDYHRNPRPFTVEKTDDA